MSGASKRQRVLSNKAADADNIAEPAISAHKRSRGDKSATPSVGTGSTQPNSAATSSSLRPPPPARPAAAAAPAPSSSQVIDVDDAGTDAGRENEQNNKRPRLDPADDDDESNTDEEEEVEAREDKTKDVNHFFSASKQLGNARKRQCQVCAKKGHEKWLVAEATTLRRHMASSHKAVYYLWADKNNFKSMLPADRKAEREARAAERELQGILDPHLTARPPPTRVVKYSDAAFKQAAVEWLAATDQPISALQHPKFQEMIDIASRAEDGVVIPSHKETCRALLDLFRKNLTNLKTRLAKNTVGEVSLTCDAWQASNTDAYFALTGHWIEETAPGMWQQHAALFGFTRMNTAHDGVRLGRALFKIVRRVGIASKIGWITCDNASNNNTMLENFERRINRLDSRSGMKKWDCHFRHIRCLAHVINLATQAVLKTYSKAKYYDPQQPEQHEPDVLATDRDEVGLVRAIAVKVRSSAKRKETFRRVQGKKALNILLDMPVRWSSTFNMLKRASDLSKYVTEFLYRIARQEKNEDKRTKLQKLVLTDAEWKRVGEFTRVLEFADKAQQAFSSDSQPSLHHALPALESLYKAWSSRMSKAKYARYRTALEAGVSKIVEYYDKTSTSHAYTMAMILDPEQKLTHFDSQWDSELKKQVRDDAEKLFRERYLELYGEGSRPAITKPNKSSRKLRQLLAELSTDEDEPSARVGAASSSLLQDGADMSRPWLKEFNHYLDSGDEELGDDMTIVRWWGLNAHRYPVWASLARDHLAIMASSVSSECAFSSAGITITKRRNRLKGDVVEALQFIKCSISKDLLYREEVLALTEEEMMLVDDEDPEWEDIEEEGWDKRLLIETDTTDNDLSDVDDLE
ncbi:putative hAT family C-terminal dimerisation region [Lyophyllum shimeji]|uniref:HAT family C-terminal dimerisation region n=1 Tax=Lyophyllum shimeji TaxID=47721 RepID=A0A9P3UT91_LYOSH|nr:putative hAT family C-terminal dimerisation region [Lyophyllum shimeji]